MSRTLVRELKKRCCKVSGIPYKNREQRQEHKTPQHCILGDFYKDRKAEMFRHEDCMKQIFQLTDNIATSLLKGLHSTRQTKNIIKSKTDDKYICDINNGVTS